MLKFPDIFSNCRTGSLAGNGKSGCNGLKITVLAASFALLTGCVGGPGSYFETIEREKRASSPVDTSTRTADLAVTPVESNTLAPAGSEQAVVEQGETQNAATYSANSGQAFAAPNPAPDQETANEPATTRAPVELGLELGIDQTRQGNLLITTLPASQNTSPGANTIQAEENTGNAVAYADPSGRQPLPGVSDQLLASTNPPASLGGAAGTNGFAIGTPIGEENVPIIDPAEYAAEQRIPLLYSQINHGQCKKGFGPRPKKMSATNINPGDPYYIEIRMRKTPLLPVGHTYVAYGKLGADGEIVDEKLIMLAPVGGYAGAALASGIPMPGVLTPHRDDCRIRPETAYRVSLSAQRYEKLLLEVQKAKQKAPSYLLFANNCNHFMTRIAQSVGLKPPRNIYVPALEYIYAMIESNEGRKISRR